MLPKPIIDFHTHVGRLYYNLRPFTAKKLLKRLDELGISMAVILPIENPEELDYYVTTESVLRICRRYRDRLIPFCNVDPRRGILTSLIHIRLLRSMFPVAVRVSVRA